MDNQPWLLEAFSSPAPDTDAFTLRLIELVVAAIHHIGGHLFTLKPGNHSKKLHEDWTVKERNKSPEERRYFLYRNMPPYAFIHASF